MAANNLGNPAEYTGKLTLTNKAMSFHGTTILLANISKFDQYGIVRTNKISMGLMIIAGILGFFAVQHLLTWGPVVVIPAALILYLGIRERRRPNLFGLTLHLNSGERHNIISEDKEGIGRLYHLIGEAIHKDHPVSATLNFNPGRIDFYTGDTYNVSQSQVGAIGAQAVANGTTFNSGTGPSSPAS
ncbi:DUF6232 family protein [Puia sp.]|jgi:hypothetical protein|uniref:DUF6232 family protein n=1 Tax=Puia sp. TaxID=2045100 RepID=UPI002F424026